jgi:hypothetical protein
MTGFREVDLRISVVLGAAAPVSSEKEHFSGGGREPIAVVCPCRDGFSESWENSAGFSSLVGERMQIDLAPESL